MHEMSIAQNILDIVREEMERHKVKKLQAINVAVGEMSAVVPSSLSFCWKVMIDGTDLAETKFNIRVVPLTYRCFDCGEEFTAEELTFECPHCRAEKPRLTAGRELTVENIEVAD